MGKRPIKIQRQTKTMDRRIPIVIAGAFVLVAVIALVVMFISFANKEKKSNSNIYSVATNESSSADSNTPAESGDNTSNDVSSEAPKVEVVKQDAPNKVPETAQADTKYFDDAVIIGDSVSIGLKTGRFFGTENVIAHQSVGLDHVANDKAVYTNAKNEKITLMQALDALSFKPKKIYVLLGLNGLPGYENEKQIGYYKTLIEKLSAKYPDAIIYCESLTPRAETVKETYSKVTFEKINDFNKRLETLTTKYNNVYYLSVIEALSNKNGYTKAEFAETDGIHLKIAGHKAWYQYLITHVVKTENNKNYVEIEKK